MKCNVCYGIGHVRTNSLDVYFVTAIKCPECNGTGEVNNPDVCKKCNGGKKVIVSAEESPFGISTEIDCPECSAIQVIK